MHMRADTKLLPRAMRMSLLARTCDVTLAAAGDVICKLCSLFCLSTAPV